ncbi:response regulator [Bacillus piscicola]|uniref:response regulator n=1 Tax=Bacillus piscicola TaxID=1632684 RepID=UPI001F09ECB6|nr:response regulator [Bacillus piscicola]
MCKILIVDDQYGVRALLRELLSRDGISIWEAASGTEAIEALVQMNPDIVLLDVKLPGMDGVEVLKEWNRKQRASRTTFILMTAYGELESVDKAEGYGAASYITKPFDIHAVKKEVEAHLPGCRLP